MGRSLSVATVLGVACLLVTAQVAYTAAKKKKAGGGASAELNGPRAPRSGSCDNSSNPCSGQGETCKDNQCYCMGPQWMRCTKDTSHTGSVDCRDVWNTFLHCGKCDSPCPDNKKFWCQKGKCVTWAQVKCDPGRTKCKDGCFDVKTDTSNCGRCGVRCPPSWGCVNGRCIRGY